MWTKRSETFCQNLHLKYPIVQAPMAGGPTTSQLVSEVSNAGALGSIGGGYLAPEVLSDQIRSVQSLTDRPFSVNLFVSPHLAGRIPSLAAQACLLQLASRVGASELDFSPSFEDKLCRQVDVCLAERVPVISFTFGVPPGDIIRRIKEAGCTLIGTATCRVEQELLEKSGFDVVVLQGFEAGGHRGAFHEDAQPVGLVALLKNAPESNVPVVAAGGVSTGWSILACLVAGASAVQIGTAFLATVESGAHDLHKWAVMEARDTDTVLTKSFTGKLARALKNTFTREMTPFEDEGSDYPIQNLITSPIRKRSEALNNREYMALWSGQAGARQRKMTVTEMLAQLEEEVASAKSDLLGLR